jgi:small subunit ribosomal protein S16
MMVRIRLKRVGKTKQAAYRVVVADQRSPRDGRIIEAIGHYNPRVEPSEISIDADRARWWIERGAQPSDQVRKLLDIAAGKAEAPPPKPKATPARSVEATPAAEAEPEGEAAEPETEGSEEEETQEEGEPKE